MRQTYSEMQSRIAKWIEMSYCHKDTFLYPLSHATVNIESTEGAMKQNNIKFNWLKILKENKWAKYLYVSLLVKTMSTFSGTKFYLCKLFDFHLIYLFFIVSYTKMCPAPWTYKTLHIGKQKQYEKTINNNKMDINIKPK